MELQITYWEVITIVIFITTAIILFYGYYIIKAIKSGIDKGYIVQIKNENEKRLYVGHTYIRVV